MLSAECLQNNWLYLHGIILNCFQLSQKYMLFDTSKILEEILNKFELKKCLGPMCADRHCTCLTFWLKQRLGLLALKSCISFNLISLHINTKLSCQQNQHSFQIMQNAWPAYSSPHSLCKVEVQLLKKKKKKKKRRAHEFMPSPPHLKKKKPILFKPYHIMTVPTIQVRTTSEACSKWGSTSIADECFPLVSRAVKGTEQNNLRSARNDKKHFSEELVRHYSNHLFFK